MARILLIDDDANLREVAGFILTEAGHEVLPAASGQAGIDRLDEDPDLVMTDIQMPGMDGMEVLTRIRARNTPPPVIVLTAHGTVAQAVQAMRSGAFTYLLKPFDREELLLTVEQAVHTRHLELDNRNLRDLLESRRRDTGLIYNSKTMGNFVKSLKQASPSDAAILISGQSGTGKEIAARACHDLSPRWDQPFVAVNCGAIPDNLMESELFGHAKGAFTGAERASLGKIRSANKGTLFLDEIAELPLSLQPKLLRVLETKTIDPVGDSNSINVDFRLVCATNRNLEKAVAENVFREDLFFRINVLRLHLPPLIDRTEDIPLLWNHFTTLHGAPDLNSEPELLQALSERPWPGNVRQLKNLNQRMVLMHRGDVLDKSNLERLSPIDYSFDQIETRETSGGTALPLGPLPADGLSLMDLEVEVIRRALEKCGGNRSKTAIYLDIPRHVLIYRIEKFNIK